MKYFNTLPKVVTTDNNNNNIILTNLLARVNVIPELLKNPLLYYSYDIQEGETPEITALKHFGSPYYHWVILLTNDITDRFYGWPLSTYEFEQFINDKYDNPDSIHHYEIDQSSGSVKNLGPSDYSYKIEVNSDTPFAVSVSNREYEQRIQDQKRQIKLLNPAYLTILLEEFENLMAE